MQFFQVYDFFSVSFAGSGGFQKNGIGVGVRASETAE